MSSVLADMRQARQHANASMLSNNSKATAQAKVAPTHQSAAVKSSTGQQQPQSHGSLAAGSQSMLQRIYAKYDDADAVLDANIAAHSPAVTHAKHAAARPSSPGLSPIHMGALHSPFAAKGRVVADADLHHQCDHSIHSIRPDGLMAQAHGCCGNGSGSGQRHSAAAEKRHSSTDTTVSSLSSGTNGSIVSSSGGVSRDSSMHHSPANAHAHSHQHSQPQSHGVTRPADLYGAEAERADFFALMQRLWADHVANKPAGGAALQTRLSRPATTTSSSSAQVHPQPQPSSVRARSVTRSASTTLTSTPAGSSSVAQSNASTPDRSGSVASGSGSAAAAGESSFAVWERQILAWEARLCAWKNAQEAALSARVVELERARTSMEAQMSAQEALYERRQSKLRSSVAALDERKAAFAREVETNSQRENQLRALLVSRQGELERREAKFAKLRREAAEASASGRSVDEAALQRLTQELSASFEAREKQLSESYAAKTRKLEEELLANKSRESNLRQLQAQAAELAARAEARAEARVRAAEVQADTAVSERTRALEAEWSTRLETALSTRVGQVESRHTAALLSLESTWQSRSNSWLSQKESMHSEIIALKSEAIRAADKADLEVARLQGQVEMAQKELQQLRSAQAASSSSTSPQQPQQQPQQQAPSHDSAEVRARMTEQFDAELTTLRAQHEAELQEMGAAHRETVRDMEQALLSAAERERAANALATQLRAAISSAQQRSAAAEFAWPRRARRCPLQSPPPHLRPRPTPQQTRSSRGCKATSKPRNTCSRRSRAWSKRCRRSSHRHTGPTRTRKCSWRALTRPHLLPQQNKPSKSWPRRARKWPGSSPRHPRRTILPSKLSARSKWCATRFKVTPLRRKRPPTNSWSSERLTCANKLPTWFPEKGSCSDERSSRITWLSRWNGSIPRRCRPSKTRWLPPALLLLKRKTGWTSDRPSWTRARPHCRGRRPGSLPSAPDSMVKLPRSPRRAQSWRRNPRGTTRATQRT